MIIKYKAVNNYKFYRSLIMNKFLNLYYLICEEFESRSLPNRCFSNCSYIKYGKISGHSVDRFLERFWDKFSENDLFNILTILIADIDKSKHNRIIYCCNNILLLIPIIKTNHTVIIPTIRALNSHELNRNSFKNYPDFNVKHLDIPITK